MSHIASHLASPSKPDRGRRLLPSASLYQHPATGDYLHDHRPLHEQCTPLVGAASARPQRFHRGFYRRSETDCGTTGARERAQADRERRGEEVGRQRREVLAARQRPCADERDMCAHKRHFAHHHSTASLLAPPPPPAAACDSPSPPPRTPLLPPPFTTTSRVIGARSGGGGGDVLGSYGVLDCFMGDGYGSADWRPVVKQRPSAKQNRLEGLDARVSVGAVTDAVGLGDERRQRQMECARNARRGSQLHYLFGSAAERAQSV